MFQNGNAIGAHGDAGAGAARLVAILREHGITLAGNPPAAAFRLDDETLRGIGPEFDGEGIGDISERRRVGIHDAAIDPVKTEALSHHSRDESSARLNDACDATDCVISIVFRPPPAHDASGGRIAGGSWIHDQLRCGAISGTRGIGYGDGVVTCLKILQIIKGQDGIGGSGKVGGVETPLVAQWSRTGSGHAELGGSAE